MLNIIRSLRLLILAAILGSSISANAQPGLSSQGRDFWLGFMPNADLPAQALAIHVATDVANRIKVETYGEGGNIVRTQSITLAAHQSHRFEMSVGLSETRVQETPQYKAIRVTSSSPCAVSGLSDNQLSTEAYLGLPITTYGTEYYCVSYYDDQYWFLANSHLGGEFLIVAPYDDTKVTIRTTAQTTTSEDGKTIGHDSGAVWSVTLAKGQTYLVQSTGWNFGVGDLTGSRVTSSKPIGFLTGHQRAQIETTLDNSKDHLIEMIPPTNLWGTEYIGIPQYKRLVGSYYRVLSAEPGNTIAVSGLDTVLNLDAGEFASLSEVKQAVQFKSTNGKRFIVMQYGYHQNYGGDPNLGDPYMVTLIPTSAFVSSATFRLPQNVGSGFNHYAIIVSTSEGIDALTLRVDSKPPVPMSQFSVGIKTTIPGTNYSFGIFRLTSEPVAFNVSSSAPFSLKLHGLTQTEGYAHPGASTFTSDADGTSPTYTTNGADSCGNITLRIRDDNGIADIFLITKGDTTLFHSPSFTENYTMLRDPDFEIGDTATTVTLSVTDRMKPASLALYILGMDGEDSLFTRTFSPKEIEWTLDEPFPAIMRLGDTVCRTLTLRNLHTDSALIHPRMVQAGSDFQLSPSTEFWLGPNDSITVDLCFIPTDSLLYSDSVSLTTACYTAGFRITTKVVEAKIFSDDADYGIVPRGTEVCKSVEITNRTVVPITIIGFEQSGDSGFTVVSPAFPIELAAGAKVNVEICFTPPRDTGNFDARIDWLLNRPTTRDRTFSILTAITLPASVEDADAREPMLWPNPAADLVSLNLNSGEAVLRAYAIDVLGTKHEISFGPSGKSWVASIASLSSGIYQLVIGTDSRTLNRPLVIKR